MATYKLSRYVLRPIPFQFWQAGKIAPINCIGFTCEIADSSLPFAPVITAIDHVTGRFQINAFTQPQAASLVAGRQYGAHILLKNGGGTPVEEFRIVFEAA